MAVARPSPRWSRVLVRSGIVAGFGMGLWCAGAATASAAELPALPGVSSAVQVVGDAVSVESPAVLSVTHPESGSAAAEKSPQKQPGSDSGYGEPAAGTVTGASSSSDDNAVMAADLEYDQPDEPDSSISAAVVEDIVEPVTEPVVEDVVEPVTEPATEVADPVADIVTEAAEPVTDTVDEVAAPVVDTVTQVGAPVLDTATDALDPVTDTAGEITAPVVDTVTDQVVEPVSGSVGPIAGGVVGTIVDTAGGSVVDPVAGTIDPVVSPVPSTLPKPQDGIVPGLPQGAGGTTVVDRVAGTIAPAAVRSAEATAFTTGPVGAAAAPSGASTTPTGSGEDRLAADADGPVVSVAPLQTSAGSVLPSAAFAELAARSFTGGPQSVVSAGATALGGVPVGPATPIAPIAPSTPGCASGAAGSGAAGGSATAGAATFGSTAGTPAALTWATTSSADLLPPALPVRPDVSPD